MNTLRLSASDRADQFPQLSRSTVYADWTGAALPSVQLIRDHARLLEGFHLGNPHSHHRPSVQAMELVNEARLAVLTYFRASPDEYDVIWTNNASGAILTLQHYLFEGGELLLTADNHNTMNGLREIARRKGAVTRYCPLNEDLTLDEVSLRQRLDRPRTNHNRLFGYPAKSNYTGVEHPLRWVDYAQKRGWDVILDAAAFLANDRLNLSQVKPQFVPVSFYKMFGYPTGIGCLLIRKDAFPRLHKQWFSGGTILLVSVMTDFFAPEPAGHARFEDGTVNFQMIPAVTNGLRWLNELGDRKAHAVGIANETHSWLASLRVNGNSIVVHSPPNTDIVTFSVLRGSETVNAWEVERAADQAGIRFRTGCFCNPGANEQVMGYTVAEFMAAYNDADGAEGFTLEKLRQHSGGKPIGAVRASFGYANSPEDPARIRDFFVDYLRSL